MTHRFSPRPPLPVPTASPLLGPPLHPHPHPPAVLPFLPFSSVDCPCSPHLCTCRSRHLDLTSWPLCWACHQDEFVQEAFPGQHCSMPSPVPPTALTFPFPALRLLPAPPSARGNTPSQTSLLDSTALDHQPHKGRDGVCPAPHCHPVPGRQWEAPCGLNR